MRDGAVRLAPERLRLAQQRVRNRMRVGRRLRRRERRAQRGARGAQRGGLCVARRRQQEHGAAHDLQRLPRGVAWRGSPATCACPAKVPEFTMRTVLV